MALLSFDPSAWQEGHDSDEEMRLNAREDSDSDEDFVQVLCMKGEIIASCEGCCSQRAVNASLRASEKGDVLVKRTIVFALSVAGAGRGQVHARIRREAQLVEEIVEVPESLDMLAIGVHQTSVLLSTTTDVMYP